MDQSSNTCLILSSEITAMDNEEEDILETVMRDPKQSEDLFQYLVSLPKKGRYLQWKGYIFSLFLQFHLSQMSLFPKKIPSFKKKSRRHLNFDSKFAKFILRRLHVQEKNLLQALTPMLKNSSKAKFATMKRDFAHNGGQDYIDLIPTLVNQEFQKKEFPELFRELDRWEQIKEENGLRTNEWSEEKGEEIRRNRRRKKCKKRIRKRWNG